MLVEVVGPCRLMGFMLVPAAIGWILMATTLSLPWIYVGRVITSAIGFMVTTVAQVKVFVFAPVRVCMCMCVYMCFLPPCLLFASLTVSYLPYRSL